MMVLLNPCQKKYKHRGSRCSCQDMGAKKAIEKSADYIFNLIESPGLCSCWPACAREYVVLELKKLVKKVSNRRRGRR